MKRCRCEEKECCGGGSSTAISHEEHSARKKNTHESDYFGSYSKCGIHQEMIQDKVRTEGYKRAIDACVQGKVVLDVGCGTGLLSIFAARAGASKVYAVEASDMAEIAQTIVHENNLGDKIVVFHGKMEQVTLPEKVDIIVSEWMGYCALYETMLPSVLHARDLYLKPGGLMIPSRIDLHAAPFFDDDIWTARVGFWDDVYGINMAAMKKIAVAEAFERPQVDVLPTECILGNPSKVGSIDCAAATIEQAKHFEGRFECLSIVNADVQGVVVWFSAELAPSISFDTGPFSQETHWKQVLFHFKDIHPIQQDQNFSGVLKIDSQEQCQRFIDVCITASIGDQQLISQKWQMDDK